MKKISYVVLFILLAFVAVHAQTLMDLQNQLHKIAEQEAKSVVYISTEQTIKQRVQTFDPFEYFFNNRRPQEREPKEREFKRSGLGSGFIYSKKGNEYFIITNDHVVNGADKVTITLNGGKKEYPATIVGGDSDVDIAVIKVKTKDKLSIAKIGHSDTLRIADLVLAIGNPFGLSHSVTFGIVSALGRGNLDNNKPGFTDFIQTDAAINPGNSGGPLLNLAGEVIGINAMIYSQTGGSVGIGFAIPMDIAKGIADQLISTGKIEHGWIGVGFQDLDKDALSKLGIKNRNSGMLILSVEKNGPADKGGIKVGDVLIKINNKDLNHSNDLTVVVGNSRPGNNIELTLIRNDKNLTKTVTIGKRSTKDSVATSNEKRSNDEISPKFGLTVAKATQGVVVKMVERTSIASRVGIRVDDVIYKINSSKVVGVKDFNRLLEDIEPGNGTYFFVLRNGESMIVVM